MMFVPRSEERQLRVCGGHEVFGPRRVPPGDDVLDNPCATLRTPGLPRLLAVLDGLGNEVDPLLFGERLFVGLRRSGLRQIHRVRYQGSGVYVPDEPCVIRLTLATPQFL